MKQAKTKLKYIYLTPTWYFSKKYHQNKSWKWCENVNHESKNGFLNVTYLFSFLSTTFHETVQIKKI